MSEAVRTLRHIHTSFSPPLAGRVLATLLLSAGFGAATSPLAGVWIPYFLASLLLVGALYMWWPLRGTGLRHNSYAPMRSDEVTPASLGGSLDDPRSSHRKMQVTAAVAGPAIYVLIVLGPVFPTPASHWTYAALVTAASLTALWRLVVLEAAAPAGYVPPAQLFAADPGWTPSDDAEAVAAVLYALQAVPGGRQVRRDVLYRHTRPLTSTPHNDTGTDAGLDALTARGHAATLRERTSSSLVAEWVVLTDRGRDAVLTDAATGTAPLPR
ncbi:hypothetical protein [Corynebacterium sp.]|uniref:hypothetical protein n=1 Tax=Corynebacterium sp. TaxID=1720 RepID=UPI0025BF5BDF|nr:hypothetical protein [Corynebacterium sp.]